MLRLVRNGDKVDYKTTGTLPPLEVPPDLTSRRATTATPFPTAQVSATLLGLPGRARASEAARGAARAVLPAGRRMRIERAGTQRWLVVRASRRRSCGRWCKDFWQENGFLVKIEQPEAGVMETDWAENRAKIPQDVVRDLLGKFARLGLLDLASATSSARGSSARPTARHRDLHQPSRHGGGLHHAARSAEQRTGRHALAAAAADPELEAEFLRRLMVRLGAQDEKARTLDGERRAASRSAEIKKGVDGAEHAAGDRAVRPRLAPRRPGARPRRLHRRGPRPRRRASTSCATPIPRARWREGHARLHRRAVRSSDPR